MQKVNNSFDKEHKTKVINLNQNKIKGSKIWLLEIVGNTGEMLLNDL